MSEKKLNKEVLSIDFDDDDKNYLAFSEFLEEHTTRKKDFFVTELEEMGEKLLKEKDELKKRREPQKQKYIKRILKYDNINYSLDELNEMEYIDIRKLYAEIKERNLSFIKKLFSFLLNF